MQRTFHVYFMASQSGVLYLGVTGHLSKRVYQHQQKLIPGFTRKYNCTKLIWFEPHSTARAAISREKEIKRWNRAKKIALLESLNPQWQDIVPFSANWLPLRRGGACPACLSHITQICHPACPERSRREPGRTGPR